MSLTTEQKKSLKIVTTSDDNFDQLWERAIDKFPGATVFYMNSFRQYDRHLFEERLVHDDSFVVISDANEPLAIVPLYCFKKENGEMSYRYGEGFLRAPLIKDMNDPEVSKRLLDFIYSRIDQLTKEKGVGEHLALIESIEVYEERLERNYLTDYRYQDCSAAAGLIDCTQDEAALRSNLRKSYKPLVNKAARNYALRCIFAEEYDEAECEAYRLLHAKAAGRQTRSVESFKEMYQMIKNNEAFLILIKDAKDNTVGAYFFLFKNGYAFYGSAATDPELDLQSGVGHLGLWSGILQAKARGCKLLDLGQTIVADENSNKIKNIDFFKGGFGSELVTTYRGIKTYEHD